MRRRVRWIGYFSSLSRNPMKARIVLATSAVLLLFASCSEHGLKALQGVTEAVLTDPSPAPSLGNDDVIAGLREALVQGTEKGVNIASAVDGFYKNDLLFIACPPEAKKVKEKALQLGLNAQVHQFEQTLNRAAEEAVKTAAPIFGQAIREMTIADGFTILRGQENAATNYLREKTTARLQETFRPEVQSAIDKVQLTKHWEPLASKYNLAVQFTGGEPVNPDLTSYVTERTVEGLFVLIESEEKNIRKNPDIRTTELLQRVFGSVQ